MRYLLVLDARSAAGAIYAHAENDGGMTDGTVIHPVLACTDVDTTQTHYVWATRHPKESSVSSEVLVVPHSSVVAIRCYDVNDPAPSGFTSLP